jgi:heme-degrading monooxygenase HmoA
MIVTVFRSRLNPGVQEEYAPMAKRMGELARTIPGYCSHKGFVAEDGERVTIVEFETEKALSEWSRHSEHSQAKKKGVGSFFSEYSFQICDVIRNRSWIAKSRSETEIRPDAKIKPSAEIRSSAKPKRAGATRLVAKARRGSPA